MKTITEVNNTYMFFDTTYISEYSIDIISSTVPCVHTNDVLVIANDMLLMLEEEQLEALMSYKI